jgi:hypothetical protein
MPRFGSAIITDGSTLSLIFAPKVYMLATVYFEIDFISSFLFQKITNPTLLLLQGQGEKGSDRSPSSTTEKNQKTMLSSRGSSTE